MIRVWNKGEMLSLGMLGGDTEFGNAAEGDSWGLGGGWRG